jgi:hypothetical protein
VGSDIVVDQQQTPADLSFNGGQWKRLFSVAAFSGGLTAQVDASQANRQVAVDGLFVAEIQDGGVPIVNDYDDLGELAQSIDRRGQPTQYAYDGASPIR